MHRGLPSLLCAILLVIALPSCSSSDDTASCAPDNGDSIAREWNEAALDAVRRDYPAPTIHARNLYHLSAVMWDTWTAFETDGTGVFFTERLSPASLNAESGDTDAFRHATLSYAAHTFLSRRYAGSPGALESLAQFDAVMERHCYDIDAPVDEPDTPAAIGRRIAGVVIDASIADGSLEPLGYKGPYEVINEPLLFEEPGTQLVDVNRWQPLEFTSAAPQFDLDIDGGVQTYTTPQWGAVTPFALTAPADGALPLDPGPPPLLGMSDADDQQFRDGVVEVLRAASELGDWERSIAEFWADGPNSETPPGHWNTLANEVGDGLAERRFAGVGPELDRLEWDIQTYVVLNGALHDAAIASWGVKEFYDYGRPISMIRHMGAQGQSSDPSAPSFSDAGLPLVEGLIELVTDESAAADGPHAHLADHIGEVAVRTWIGPTVMSRPATDTAETGASDIGWILAIEWLPYQQADFVTPSFPGYVSGHSTFSAAAAEIMTLVTASERFPEGTGEWTVPAGSLKFDEGPSTDVTLQWTTFHDAADEAGLSRIYGGIHVPADDVPGRELGIAVAQQAWARAAELFATN